MIISEVRDLLWQTMWITNPQVMWDVMNEVIREWYTTMQQTSYREYMSMGINVRDTVVGLVGMFVLRICTGVGQSMIGRKIGMQHNRQAWIPVVSVYHLCRLADAPRWLRIVVIGSAVWFGLVICGEIGEWVIVKYRLISEDLYVRIVLLCKFMLGKLIQIILSVGMIRVYILMLQRIKMHWAFVFCYMWIGDLVTAILAFVYDPHDENNKNTPIIDTAGAGCVRSSTNYLADAQQKAGRTGEDLQKKSEII